MRLVLCAAVVLSLAGCATPSIPTAPATAAAVSTTPAAPRATLKEGQVIGAPHTFGNLTVFPVTATGQKDIGPLTTLEAALAKGDAVVREMQADPTPRLRERRDAEGNVQQVESGPQVNALVVENNGSVPLYVLAGTVVEGGNQDREIGQDFIVPAHQSAPVEAFCVEHGRWNGARGGNQTGGRFGTARQLATGRVRAAGQYQHDQGEVWSNVAKVNEANGQRPESGTLAATLDDGAIAGKRAGLASQVEAYLKSLPEERNVVGVAYAIGGQVHAVRFFANHQVWGMFRTVLVSTAAGEAVTAEAGASGTDATPLTPFSVARFIEGVDEAKVKEARATAAANVNDYRETDVAYGSATTLKADSPSAPAVRVSADYLRKR